MKEAASFRYFGIVTVLYVTMQLVSDVTGGKLITLQGLTVSVTALYFPFTYIFSDILTEVYGYARARRVLFTVLGCSIMAGLIYQLAAWLPPAPGFDADAAYKRVLYQVPRILAGGWLAVFAGETVNNYLIARLKVVTNGSHLWLRLVSSTVGGQFVNTVIFYVVGLYGIIPTGILISSVISGWILKCVVEVIMVPVTYRVVAMLKRVEGIDYFDRDTDFNPFIVHS